MRTAFLLLALPLAAAGQVEPGLRDLLNARSIAMGGAYEGLGVDADTVNGNPAAMTAIKRYQIELGGDWDFGNKYAFAGSSIVDSQTNPLGAGLSYHLVTFGRGPLRRTANVSTVALSLPLADAIHIGVAATHYLLNGATSADAISGTAGVLIKLGDSFHLSASGHNLIDVRHPDITRYYVFSAAFAGGAFNADADLRADFDSGPRKFLISGGLEYIFGSGFPIRAGYAYDAFARGHYLSAGTGFATAEGGFDVAYRQEVNGPGRMLALTLNVRIQP